MTAACDLAGDRLIDRARGLCRLHQTRGQLEHPQGTPCIAVRGLCHQSERLRRRTQVFLAEAALGVIERSTQQRDDVIHGQGSQNVNPRARQQRTYDLERWILCRRADEDESAVLEKRQKRILLRFIEAMDFIEKQHGRLLYAARTSRARSTAARMSFTPAITADNAMNSA